MKPLLQLSMMAVLALGACKGGDKTTAEKAGNKPAEKKPVASPMVKDDKPAAKPTAVKAEPKAEEPEEPDTGGPEEPEDPEEPGDPEDAEEPE